MELFARISSNSGDIVQSVHCTNATAYSLVNWGTHSRETLPIRVWPLRPLPLATRRAAAAAAIDWSSQVGL